jgi:CMP-N-acetylneuraminic acid synthetase
MNTIPVDENIVIGLIPARGGSKSIPLKNVVLVAGRPMIAYVIAAGLGAGSLSRVVCSSDHPAIASVCLELGVEVLERPAYLGEDDTPVTDVILHVLETIAAQDGVMPGMVALLQPTSPFMLSGHIDACVEALRANPDADSAQTITPVIHNAHAFNQRVLEDGLVHFRFLEERRAAYNKQRKPKHYTFGNLV